MRIVEKISRWKVLIASCIIIPHILQLNISSGALPIYYFGHLSLLFGLLYTFKNEKLIVLKLEIVPIFLMAVVPLVWFLFQAVWFSSWEIFCRALNFLMFVLAGYYLGVHIGLYLILRILRWFVIGNIICIALWTWFGNSATVESFGLGTFAFEWLGIYQRIAVEEYSIRFAGLTSNPNNLAIWGALGWLGTVIFQMPKKEQTIWFIIGMILLFLTQSRAAFMVAVIYYLVYSLVDKGKKAMYIVKILFVISLSILILVKFADFRSANLSDDWSSGRAADAEILYEKLVSNEDTQLFGIGMGKINTLLAYDYEDKNSIDSSLLCVIIENGYCGAFLLLSIFLLSGCYSLFVSGCCDTEAVAILLAFYIAMGLYGLFETGLYRNSLIHSIWVAFTFYGLSVTKAQNVNSSK